jgi:hypothetical protein
MFFSFVPFHNSWNGFNDMVSVVIWLNHTFMFLWIGRPTSISSIDFFSLFIQGFEFKWHPICVFGNTNHSQTYKKMCQSPQIFWIRPKKLFIFRIFYSQLWQGAQRYGLPLIWEHGKSLKLTPNFFLG